MPEQVARFLAVLREPVRTMVLLAILTGLRVGEILALRWQDLDLDRVPAHQREAVAKLAQMVRNGDEFGLAGKFGIGQPTLLQ
jgi:integrase